MMSRKVLCRLVTLLSILWMLTLIIAIVLGARLSWYRDPARADSINGPKSKSKWSNYKVLSVATDNELCSAIGRDVLTYGGGSTADAAIAAMICLGMVNPQHSGIGGGFMAIIYDRSKNESIKNFTALNARETVPPSVDINFYDNNPASAAGGPLSTLIPGEINGYYELWKRYGKIAWKDLFQPTIRLGREGWKVTHSMDVAIRASTSYIKIDPGMSELLLKDDGTPYKTGDLIRNSRLADTLQLVSNEGPQVFYSGSLAQDMLLDLKDIGGPNFTIDDLESNKALFVDPLKTSLPWTGYDLYTTPPPSSGALTAFALKIMDGYNYSSSQLIDSNRLVLFYHRFIEAWKITFAETVNLGDIQNNTSVEKWMAKLLDDKNVDRFRRIIKDDIVLDPSSLSTLKRQNEGGTSGVLVMTADGSGISTTTTVGGFFGCKKRGKRTGIIFNDGMSLFNVRSSTNISANYIAPLKHGRSSVSPMMIFDSGESQLKLMHAGSGSQRIITSMSLIASQILWRGLTPVEATNEPRVHHQGSPNTVLYDDAISQAIIDGLRNKGHSVQSLSATPRYSYIGVTQTLQAHGCTDCPQRVNLTAVSDFRKGIEAAPSGF